jgi:hypothetical protein
MKRTLLLILFLLSFLNNVDAQWYFKNCSVTDINNLTPEEFECLWNKSINMVRGGAITTAIGTPTIIISLILFRQYSLFSTEAGIALLFCTIGTIMDLIGIPILIAGIVRKSQLKETPYYQNLKLGSVNLSPKIGLNQYNGSHYFGMGLSLNF